MQNDPLQRPMAEKGQAMEFASLVRHSLNSLAHTPRVEIIHHGPGESTHGFDLFPTTTQCCWGSSMSMSFRGLRQLLGRSSEEIWGPDPHRHIETTGLFSYPVYFKSWVF